METFDVFGNKTWSYMYDPHTHECTIERKTDGCTFEHEINGYNVQCKTDGYSVENARLMVIIQGKTSIFHANNIRILDTNMPQLGHPPVVFTTGNIHSTMDYIH